MASNNEPTGHNIKEDDDWVPNPDKLKPRVKKSFLATTTADPTPPPAPSYSSYTPPPPPPAPVVEAAPPPPPPVLEVVQIAPPPVQQAYTPPPSMPAPDFGSVGDGPAKPDEHWMKAYWRPAMGWLYMIICFMDFVGFPLLTIFLPIIFKPFGLTMPYQAWQSLTLSNGGLMHLAFGAILGVSAFTRGQEKIAKV